ncbi:MAG: hypothetical protein QOD93_3362, partial [Acetobacteraceae bacterium]|nr:hypothetical protein [Acetobacteraceae bacterium]
MGGRHDNTRLAVPGCTLAWPLLDLTPPWLTAPETIVMHHGIGANQDICRRWSTPTGSCGSTCAATAVRN